MARRTNDPTERGRVVTGVRGATTPTKVPTIYTGGTLEYAWQEPALNEYMGQRAWQTTPAFRNFSQRFLAGEYPELLSDKRGVIDAIPYAVLRSGLFDITKVPSSPRTLGILYDYYRRYQQRAPDRPFYDYIPDPARPRQLIPAPISQTGPARISFGSGPFAPNPFSNEAINWEQNLRRQMVENAMSYIGAEKGREVYNFLDADVTRRQRQQGRKPKDLVSSGSYA